MLRHRLRRVAFDHEEARRRHRRLRSRCGGEFAIKRARGGCAAAALAKTSDFENSDGAVECDRHDVARTHRLTGREHAFAVDAHVPGVDQCGGIAARPHHAGVPEPLIDALAPGIQGLARLLLLELLLERGELGEWRVRVRLFVAALAAMRTRVILLARCAVGTIVTAATRPARTVVALVALRAEVLSLR